VHFFIDICGLSYRENILKAITHSAIIIETIIYNQ